MPSASTPIQIFVNERPLTVERSQVVLEAVCKADAALGEALRSDGAYVTDGVGRKIDPANTVTPGGIYRVIVSARHRSSDGSHE